jgi:hypothetical protein
MIQYPVPPSQWRCLPANQLDTVIGLIETARDVLDRIEQHFKGEASAPRAILNDTRLAGTGLAKVADLLRSASDGRPGAFVDD